MNKDTYEFENRETDLETYEWDDLWWEHTERRDLPRVTYIGDSISRGTRKVLNSLAGGKICFDGFATSKALDNPYLCHAISYFAAQQSRCDAVLFNNGLHGWHLDDQAYEVFYEKTICSIREIYTGKPIVAVLTTYLGNSEQNKRVMTRNEITRRIAEKYGLPILDFYAVSLSNANWLIADGVHFEKEGYYALAQAALDFVLPIVGA